MNLYYPQITQEKLGRDFFKKKNTMNRNGPGRQKLSRKKSLAVSEACVAMF